MLCRIPVLLLDTASAKENRALCVSSTGLLRRERLLEERRMSSMPRTIYYLPRRRLLGFPEQFDHKDQVLRLQQKLNLQLQVDPFQPMLNLFLHSKIRADMH